MGTLAALITNLSKSTDRLINNLATDSFYVLRVSQERDGRGGMIKEYVPTTGSALPCFYKVLPPTAQEREEMRATKRAPVISYKFVVQSDVDVVVTDRLRLVAREPVGEKEFAIVRVADPLGLTREVIAIEEVPIH